MSTMEENKFEKQVRQKLDELKMAPSDSIWEHVKDRIGKKKDRKTGLLILVLLLALLAPAGYWLYHSKSSSISNNTVVKNETIQGNENNNSKIKHLSKPDKEVPLNDNVNTISSDVKSSTASKNKDITTNESILSKPAKYKENTKGNFSVKQFVPEVEESNELATKEPSSNKKAVAEPNDTTAYENNDIAIGQKPVIEKQEVPVNPIPDTSGSQDVAKTEIKQPDTAASLSNPKIITETPMRKWHLGIFLSGGISHVGNQFLGLGQFFGSGRSNADYLQNPGGINNGGGNSYYMPSTAKKRSGLIAGMFLEKNISSKTKISFGINYKEFNTSNLVGQRNDTTGTYSSRNTQARYYNNFKFIELPLQLKIQLGKRKTSPLFWSGGIILSQLINSNALQFDQYTGTYFKDNSLFNKTQIGFSTGLSTALLQNQKSAILLGPYFYYAASQLANNGFYYKKHFVFFGLHTEILFKKK